VALAGLLSYILFPLAAVLAVMALAGKEDKRLSISALAASVIGFAVILWKGLGGVC
jgi:hypothetical protein